MFYIVVTLTMFLLIQLNSVSMYSHQKTLKQKVWNERCKRNSVVLNDCNWCWCDQNQHYQCKARVCEEVDMFGHFKDTIRDIDVGMEGRGSWRTKSTSCSPGVQYRRGNVQCVCDEDGNWPNPVCRDLFRVLHSVEVTGKANISNNQSCVPGKLHLVGCNTCFCPSTSVLDPEFCTKKACDESDPVVETKDDLSLINVSPNDNEYNDFQVYATCVPKYKYQLGCRECNCIGNNRLLCDNCVNGNEQHINGSSEKSFARINSKSYCRGKKPGKIFKIKCNSCHCDKQLSLFCTAKKCIKLQSVKLKSGFKLRENIRLKQVEAPPDDQSCVSGTQYKRECNICKCFKLRNGVKIVDCSLNKCKKKNPIEDQKDDCLEKSYYELDCKVCYCYIKNGVKHQVCQIYDNCVTSLVHTEKLLQGGDVLTIDAHHGYCEPLHKYRNSCNMCRCLSDGKTFMCDSKVCIERTSESLSVDVVPVHMKTNDVCPKGHSYKLDCNICFCLSTGNAICTTMDCSRII